MGVGFLMRMVSAALGVKEREKKRKERGGCRSTTRPDWSHPSVLGLLSELCLWGRWNLCVHTINISVSFALCRGGTCKEEPQTGEYRCFILILPSLCLAFLLLFFFTLFPNPLAHYLCHWSSVPKRFYNVTVLAERVWCAPQYKRSGGGLWNHVVRVGRGVFPPGRWAGFIGHMGVLY